MRGIQLLSPSVVHTQLGNGRGRGVGYRPTPLADGDLDMPAVLELLWRAGYHGTLCTQYEGPDDTDVYGRDIAFLRGQYARR